MVSEVFNTAKCGEVVVTEYKNSKNVSVCFLNTGYVTKTTKRVLTGSQCPRLHDPLAPTVFGIGRIGVGPHVAHHKGADTKPFRIWRAMLRRCYYGPENYGTRVGCTVCDEWLDFQVFADWFEKNYPKDGGSYQLDKDIKVPGNKTYGPETCSFVTQIENLEARRFRK